MKKNKKINKAKKIDLEFDESLEEIVQKEVALIK